LKYSIFHILSFIYQIPKACLKLPTRKIFNSFQDNEVDKLTSVHQIVEQRKTIRQ